jgi:hypothetical protein
MPWSLVGYACSDCGHRFGVSPDDPEAAEDNSSSLGASSANGAHYREHGEYPKSES